MQSHLTPTRPVILTLQLVALCSFAGVAQVAGDDSRVERQWDLIDERVDLALEWLAKGQQRNGSFPTLPQGQPGVTALCVLAFAAHGHLPGEGSYGDQLSRAVDFIISCQKQNGLISFIGRSGVKLSRNVSHDLGTSTAYNHAIASLTLSEIYGIGGTAQATKLESVIEKSLAASLQMHRWPAERKVDEGGWRYIHSFQGISADLSITGWELMFLRSSKNAGFDVPEKTISEAVGYVRRCFHPEYKTFLYKLDAGDTRSRAMAGAGVLALAHAGLHNTNEAQQAADWILTHDFNRYNELITFPRQKVKKDRYHYGVFNCAQAMYQIGGEHWERFFPAVAKTLLQNQNPDGSWQAERHRHETKFGRAYSTSLVLLTLGAPNQLLPVFQR